MPSPYAVPTIQDWPLPYVERLAARTAEAIDLVVIHCTELPDLAIAREYGERECHPSGSGNSGHYYIDRDGGTSRFVDPLRAAHHTRGYNERSIGIELVNLGRYPLWFDSRHQDMTEPYTEAQIEALLLLLAQLRQSLPRLALIAGHEDLDRGRVPASDDAQLTVHRKLDPGPLFPWQRVEHACGLRRLHGGEGTHATSP
jgi:N-acetylmuramoyl-L-alanine amidase